MSLIRKLKRKYERDNRHRDMRELYAHVDMVSERQKRELQKEYREAAMSEDAKNSSIAMYYLFGIHLHKLFGFGGQRCLRLFEAIDRDLGTWKEGNIEIEDLREELKQAIGIDVRLT